MSTVHLSIIEPFTSPTWGSNFGVFSSSTGVPIPEEDTKEYLARACRYAKRFEIYLVPERFIMLGTQSMALIGPDGKVIGAQQAIFQNPEFAGLNPGKQIKVWHTAIGEIYLSVDVDIYHPELVKIAYNQGANLVVASQCLTLLQHNHHRIVAGVWNGAQTNPLFVVGVCNQFQCVAAPRLITKRKDGFYASPTTVLPVTAKFDPEWLQKLPLKPALSRGFYTHHKEQLIGSTQQISATEQVVASHEESLATLLSQQEGSVERPL